MKVHRPSDEVVPRREVRGVLEITPEMLRKPRGKPGDAIRKLYLDTMEGIAADFRAATDRMRGVPRKES